MTGKFSQHIWRINLMSEQLEIKRFSELDEQAVLYDESVIAIDDPTPGRGTKKYKIKKLENYVTESLLLTQLDGTKDTYNRVMRTWFFEKGLNAMTADGLTALCEEWYTVTRDGWEGYTTFAQPDVSAVSTGTKGGDNATLSCTPSTDTTAGQDDYAGLPLFACVDVNYTVDSTSLDIKITAIDGITDNFKRYDTDTFVGVMQMAGYHFWREDGTSYTHGYTDHVITGSNCAPLPESVRVDGTVRKFVVHGKYYSKTVSSKLTSCAGVIPTAFVSHNGLHTLSSTTGAQYSGGCVVDWSFLILMTYIKYASLTLDGIMQGCCNYNYQLYAQVSETGVRRILIASSDASKIKVGSSILIGTYNGSSVDRGVSANYNISTIAGAIVTAVESVTINGTTYAAVYVDTESTFNTVANGNSVSGSTIISTWHWKSGTTDAVLGNDGSPVSNTSGVYPYKLQGIEVMVGGYEVMADVIMNEATSGGHSYYTPHVVKRSANQSTSITANYAALTNLAVANPSTAGWQYIKRLGFQDGVFYQKYVGGGSTQYTKDGFYMDADGTTGTREWLAFGRLSSGSGGAGLSCLTGDGGLGAGIWYCLARLSPNGNRGEWAA